jgi:hypothetical protein
MNCPNCNHLAVKTDHNYLHCAECSRVWRIHKDVPTVEMVKYDVIPDFVTTALNTKTYIGDTVVFCKSGNLEIGVAESISQFILYDRYPDGLFVKVPVLCLSVRTLPGDVVDLLDLDNVFSLKSWVSLYADLENKNA